MQTNSRLSPLSGATGSASPGVPRRRRLAIARAYFHDASVLVLAQARSGPGRPSTGVLEALHLGGAHNLDLGEGCDDPIVLD